MPVQTRSRSKPSLTTVVKNAVATPKKAKAKAKPTTPSSKVTKKKATPTSTRQKRKTGIADKIEGVLLKVEGTLTERPGVKVR